jgi:hypothetical protein
LNRLKHERLAIWRLEVDRQAPRIHLQGDLSGSRRIVSADKLESRV